MIFVWSFKNGRIHNQEKRNGPKGERMNILVTGATGKIGSRLVPSLLDAGYKVRILVRRPDNDIVNGLIKKGAEAYVGDIMRTESLPDAIDGMDAIVHLAAFFRSQDSEKNPKNQHRWN